MLWLASIHGIAIWTKPLLRLLLNSVKTENYGAGPRGSCLLSLAPAAKLVFFFLWEVMWAFIVGVWSCGPKSVLVLCASPEICESLGIQFRVSKLPRFMKRGVISCFFLLWIFHPMRWGPVFFRVRPVFWIHVSESAVLLPKPPAQQWPEPLTLQLVSLLKTVDLP